MIELTDEELTECDQCGLTIVSAMTWGGQEIPMEPDPAEPPGSGNCRLWRDEDGKLRAEMLAPDEEDAEARNPHVLVCTGREGAA